MADAPTTIGRRSRAWSTADGDSTAEPTRFSSRAWWYYLALMAVGIFIYYFAVTGTTQGFVYDAFGLFAAAAILIGVRRHRPARRGPWYAFAAGLGMWALGDITNSMYGVFGTTVPTPSLADALYLAGYPALGIGMLLMIRARMPRSQLSSALDGFIVAVSVGALEWVFILGNYARQDSMSVPARTIAIAYPALDLILVAVIVRLIFSEGVRNTSYRLLFASVAVVLTADILSTFATIHGWFPLAIANPLSGGWLASYALWGASALHPSMKGLTDPSPKKLPRYRSAALALLGLAAMVAPILVFIQEQRGRRLDVIVLTAISVVVFTMVVSRMWLVGRELGVSNNHLADAVIRQTVFATAAEAFVGASDLEGVAQAGVRAALALVRDGLPWATFVVEGPLSRMVVAVAGDAPFQAGDRYDGTTQETLDRKYDAASGVTTIEAGRRNRTAAPRELFSVPVVVGDEVRGRLELGLTKEGEEDLAPSLTLISAEMGLALKSVETTEERLRQRNERRFRSFIQKSTDLYTLIDPSGRIVYQSPSASTLLGFRPSRMMGKQMSTLVHPDDVATFEDRLATVQLDNRQQAVEFECRFATAEGTWRVVDSYMTNLLADPDVGAILVNSRDVTERRSLERQLAHQAFHDSLTGLANRALFTDRLGQLLQRARRESVTVAVMFLDIDDFKNINDSLGHEAGDRVLVAVGQRLGLALRPGDTLARFGGDEFAILLEFGTVSDVEGTVATRIFDALRDPIVVGNDRVSLQVSIGIAMNNTPEEGADDLLRNADLAMYSAKRNGKNRCERYRQEMYNDAVYRYDLAAELRQALIAEELQVFYQPIVTAHDTRLVGVEALVRWNHGRLGMIPAIDFIEIAESTNLIIPLGEWVLNQACAQAQAWKEGGVVEDAFYVSVNLSAHQLADPLIVDKVARALGESKLPSKSLVLEITESVLMLDFEACLGRLNSLKSLGLRLAIDDYGTGYSTLHRLADLPVQIVKIDKSFIDRLTQKGPGRALVQSIIDLTSALGMSCVAEGVEVQAQRTALDEMGCDDLQGYLFAKAMPPIEAGVMLRVLGMSLPSTA
jgi:diguanylate cyclase (GGDEF)-like protein/PAS domain S-box-containing protein